MNAQHHGGDLVRQPDLVDALPHRFDYHQLDSATRIVVEQKTTEIRDRLKIAGDAMIAIGERLMEVKARLPHGQFGPWLSAEFAWSQDTAGGFMNVARLARQNPKFSEYATLFDRSALLLLAAPSTPVAAQEAALERAASGEHVRHRDAKALIAEQNAPRVAPPAAVTPGAIHPLIAAAMDEPPPPTVLADVPAAAPSPAPATPVLTPLAPTAAPTALPPALPTLAASAPAPRDRVARYRLASALATLFAAELEDGDLATIALDEADIERQAQLLKTSPVVQAAARFLALSAVEQEPTP